MKKHAVKIILLLAFMLLFVAACNRTTEQDSSADATSPPTTGDQTTPPTGGDDPTSPPQGETGELRGRIHQPDERFSEPRVLRVGAWWEWPVPDMMMPNDGPDDEPNRETSQNYPIERMRWDNARRVEEVFNVRFESVVIDFENYFPQLANTVMAGAPFADVVMLSGWMQMDAMENIIQPWNPVNLPNSDIFGPQIYAGPTTMDELYVWTINPHGVEAGALGIGVNLDIIEREGLPNPVELYESGQWTWDAMLDIMRRATRDTTGDGVNDQFGISGQPGDIIMHLLAANDGPMVTSDFNYGLDHPNSVRALEFAQQIFRERLWYPEVGGLMDTGNWDRNFYSYSDGVSALFPIVTWAVGNSPIEFNFAYVPFPLGPNSTSGNTWTSEIPQGFSVPIGSSWTVDELLIIFEELYSWPDDEPELLFEAGQIDWMRDTYLTEEDVQRAVINGTRGRADIGRDITNAEGHGYFWIFGSFASAFWDDEMDVMQAIEHNRGPQQEMLDARFRQ